MNSTYSRKTMLVFGMGLLFSITSFAQNQDRRGPKKPPTFTQLIEELDANEDGKLSKEELKGPLKENFDAVDTDKDGFITEEEFDKAPRPRRKERGRN